MGNSLGLIISWIRSIVVIQGVSSLIGAAQFTLPVVWEPSAHAPHTPSAAARLARQNRLLFAALLVVRLWSRLLPLACPLLLLPSLSLTPPLLLLPLLLPVAICTRLARPAFAAVLSKVTFAESLGMRRHSLPLTPLSTPRSAGFVPP